MNPRERFIATMTFGKPDRIPFTPGGGRQSTLANWHKQGLPPEIKSHQVVAYVCQLIGIEQEETPETIDPGWATTMMPEFEEKVVKELPNSRIVQDWKGNICEIGKEFDPSYLRGAPDFVTRSWLKCPVESRADWPEMKRRYDPDHPDRFPDDFKQRAAKLKDRNYICNVFWSGPFWQLREWCGFEGLCMLLLDDPDLVQEMIDFWENYMATMLQRLLEEVVPDMVTVNEDMAYKEKPMIGPDQCRKFMTKCWTRWGKLLDQAGVPIYEIDSDGHVGLLIPVWLESGVNANSPMEVAAGNDLPAYRQKYGKKMAYRGGVDKRAMAKGGQILRDEMARLQPAIEAGGYIPSCDHGVPHDVSWPNFLDYCKLLAQATGWL